MTREDLSEAVLLGLRGAVYAGVRIDETLDYALQVVDLWVAEVIGEDELSTEEMKYPPHVGTGSYIRVDYMAGARNRLREAQRTKAEINKRSNEPTDA